MDVMLKRFESPDEVREMVKGRFELVHIGPSAGATHCSVEHVGLVLAGTATAAFQDGRVVELRTGELFHMPSEPHDSWVVGDEPYVSLHFLGAAHYAR
jgi:quercetin dioxygenase-like cupin family protein